MISITYPKISIGHILDIDFQSYDNIDCVSYPIVAPTKYFDFVPLLLTDVEENSSNNFDFLSNYDLHPNLYISKIIQNKTYISQIPKINENVLSQEFDVDIFRYMSKTYSQYEFSLAFWELYGTDLHKLLNTDFWLPGLVYQFIIEPVIVPIAAYLFSILNPWKFRLRKSINNFVIHYLSIQKDELIKKTKKFFTRLKSSRDFTLKVSPYIIAISLN